MTGVLYMLGAFVMWGHVHEENIYAQIIITLLWPVITLIVIIGVVALLVFIQITNIQHRKNTAGKI